jgi:TrkA domain protein
MMRIDRTTVPGNGTLHRFVTRDGEPFCLLVDAASNRHFFIYDGGDRDEPAREIVLQPDEADQLAELLHSHPMADRLLSLERRVDALIGERGR